MQEKQVEESVPESYNRIRNKNKNKTKNRRRIEVTTAEARRAEVKTERRIELHEKNKHGARNIEPQI